MERKAIIKPHRIWYGMDSVWIALHTRKLLCYLEMYEAESYSRTVEQASGSWNILILMSGAAPEKVFALQLYARLPESED